ncbi:MAG: rRNA maturation RNase YbeY [Clostridia bacterium]|nr:rRNA maturation RNase YbeY [Clostridia bacterium]
MRKVAEVEFLEIPQTDEYTKLIDMVLEECFREEKILDSNLYISVILTNPDEIQRLNREYRKVNKTTDVLSFPMYEREEISSLNKEIEEPIGDVIISVQKVKEQAEEYNHSFERELAYMLVHGFYHIMGYDHIEENEKKEMREKEENILNKLNIIRD